MTNPYWRINNLYKVKDKNGNVVTFKMNPSQKNFYFDQWYVNVILKARQLGFSTLIGISMLDTAVFNENVQCGIIDSSLEDAKKKLKKLEFAYLNMPDAIQRLNPITQSNAFELIFSNGSSIHAGTSHRGGTLQMLHISEHGKIAAKFPSKSREIMTGALNTVAAGQFIYDESTAEGQQGDFYDICQLAEQKMYLGSELSPMDFKFHFYPWHQTPEYAITDIRILNDKDVISPKLADYFKRLHDEDGIYLSHAQKVWYAKKLQSQKGDMKREYPSTSREAFEAETEGAIFGPYITQAAQDGRIGSFPYIPGFPVHTFWDIGRRDMNSIWFAQVFAGRVRCIHFYQNSFKGMHHYAEYILGTAYVRDRVSEFRSQKDIEGIFSERGWVKGRDVLPHDVEVIEWGSNRSRIEQGIAAGLDIDKATTMGLHDGINSARATIDMTEFDAVGCSEGLKALRIYKWKWDENRGMFITGVENHDNASHAAAAYRYLSTSWRELPPALPPKVEIDIMAPITTSDNGSVVLPYDRASDIVKLRRRMAELNNR
jgi:hypothetical protein